MGTASGPAVGDSRSALSRRPVDRIAEGLPVPDERALLEAVRSGDPDAYEVLYRIHHDAVERLARRLSRDRDEAEDVVSDVFCNMLRAVRAGSGPRDGCRAYLLRSVRHTLVKVRTRKDTGRATPCPTEELDRRGANDVPVRGGPATDALQQVSTRFQELLWYVEVQGYDSADVANHQEMAKPAAASMMYRARRALRRAYLGGCATTPVKDDGCTPIRALLPGFVDGDVATPGADRVRAHLADCRPCNRALDEMSSVYDRIGTRGLFALLPGALRAVVLNGTHATASAIGGASTLVAAATIAVGALALPASEPGADPERSPLGALVEADPPAAPPEIAASTAAASGPADPSSIVTKPEFRVAPGSDASTGDEARAVSTQPTSDPRLDVPARVTPPPSPASPASPPEPASADAVAPVSDVAPPVPDTAVQPTLEPVTESVEVVVGGLVESVEHGVHDVVDVVDEVADAADDVGQVVDDVANQVVDDVANQVVVDVAGSGGIVQNAVGAPPIVDDVVDEIDDTTDGVGAVIDTATGLLGD